MQSAKGKTKKWILDWDVLQGAGRWENPLMGWASSADYMQGTNMAFRSKEDAVAFVRILLFYHIFILEDTTTELMRSGREAGLAVLCPDSQRAQDSS